MLRHEKTSKKYLKSHHYNPIFARCRKTSSYSRWDVSLFNPFQSNITFLYRMQTSENLRMCFHYCLKIYNISIDMGKWQDFKLGKFLSGKNKIFQNISSLFLDENFIWWISSSPNFYLMKYLPFTDVITKCYVKLVMDLYGEMIR